MSHILDRMTAQEAHAKLADLNQRSQRVNVDLMRELDAARSYTDPDLSPEGLGKRRQEMADAARQKAAKALEALQVDQRQAADRIRRWAGDKRPGIGDDPVQVTKVSMAWDRARAMLDAGRSIPEVLANATDPALVLAVREFAGDWLAAQPRQADTGRPDTTGLTRTADARLAELHGGDTAAALRMLHDLEVAEAGWQARGSSVDQLGDPSARLSAALGAHYAEQIAGAGYQDGGDDPNAGNAA